MHTKKFVLPFPFGLLLLVLGLALASIPAAAASGQMEGHGARRMSEGVNFSSHPRFPVVGREAELACHVIKDGSPVRGLMAVFMVAHHEGEGDEHGMAEAEARMEETAAEEEPEAEIAATEVSPGVYMVKYTFEESGKYEITVQIGDETEEFAVAVRSRPVAWPLVMGMVAFTAGVAGMVAVRKTQKKEW